MTAMEEMESIQKAGGSAGYIIEGRMIIASVTLYEITGMGVAKCMPKDKFDEEIGFGIACSRALASVSEGVADRFAALSVTQKTWDKQQRKAK